MGPKIDVVVVSYNSRSTLRECVEPLAHLNEIFVVVSDNASQDGSPETVADLPVSIIRLERNGGFAHGCNHGWRSGSAPYVLFLNPDARIEPAAIRRLVDVLEREPEVGIAAPTLVDDEGNVDFSIRQFPRLRTTYAQALFLHRLFPRASWTDEVIRDPAVYSQPFSPQWVSGACLLVRRSLLERVGGWDEGFFLYCEDVDLCRRARDVSSDIRFVPEAVARHIGGVSAPRSALLSVLVASRVQYAKKHCGPQEVMLQRVGMALGSITHALFGRGGRAARSGHARALATALTSSKALPS